MVLLTERVGMHLYDERLSKPCVATLKDCIGFHHTVSALSSSCQAGFSTDSYRFGTLKSKPHVRDLTQHSG